MKDESKPGALSVDKQDRVVVACMNWTFLLYKVKEAVEMKKTSKV